MRIVETSTAPAAVGHYSQAIEQDGIVYTSGQIPLDPETGQLVEGGIAEQTDRVMRNLANLLIASASDVNHLLKVTIYLTDLSHFQTVNEIYAKHIGAHKPARTTIQVAALPKNALIEIDAIARVSV
jgi:2-iminobutanoate/2-iminopropanoate deaminase